MLNRFFNGRIRGIPAGGWNVFCGVWRSLARRLFSGVKLCGLGRCGKNCRLGLGVVVRYPGGIVLSDRVSIADNCFITSEFPDSRLEIGSDSHIDRFCPSARIQCKTLHNARHSGNRLNPFAFNAGFAACLQKQ